MELEAIKEAVDSGKTVHWQNSRYVVTKDRFDYLVKDKYSEHCIGLCWANGTLNGYPEDFYLGN